MRRGIVMTAANGPSADLLAIVASRDYWIRSPRTTTRGDGRETHESTVGIGIGRIAAGSGAGRRAGLAHQDGQDRRAVRARLHAGHSGAADRRAAQHKLGQSFVIENKPGASGNLGTDAVAKAEPDGATIGIPIGGPLAINTLLFSKPYDPARTSRRSRN